MIKKLIILISIILLGLLVIGGVSADEIIGGAEGPAQTPAGDTPIPDNPVVAPPVNDDNNGSDSRDLAIARLAPRTGVSLIMPIVLSSAANQELTNDSQLSSSTSHSQVNTGSQAAGNPVVALILALGIIPLIRLRK
ncbi:MAG: hypothetical protein MJ209_04075 [archaeon]|nr:hypothetical protein [archaeon]